MTTDLEHYKQQLLIALRLRDIPGTRIAETLAEVDSHIAETGEDPRVAFGAPKAYAASLAGSLDPDGARPARWRSLTWIDGLVAVASFAGAWLLTDGLFNLGAGASGAFGLPAIASAAGGLALLAGLSVWLIARVRKEADRVLDPRTGRNMAPPLPRWAVALLVATPCGMLLLGHLIGDPGR